MKLAFFLVFFVHILFHQMLFAGGKKGCKGVRYYTSQHGSNSGSNTKPASMAVTKFSPAKKKGSATMSFSNSVKSNHKGSGTLGFSSGSVKKKKPSNMGFYKPKPAKKNGAVSFAFSSKKPSSKPLPPWTKKAQRMDQKPAKSGITKNNKKPKKGSMQE